MSVETEAMPDDAVLFATLDVIREDATLGTPAHDDVEMGQPWTEDAVLRALWRHFVAQSWAPIPQVTVALRDTDTNLSGSSDWRRNREEWADRRIDLLLMRKPRTGGRKVGDLETLAVEVKVTRADFLNDIRNPQKQAPWRKAATRHAYAVPAGLVTVDEVPDGSGLLYVKHGPGGYTLVEWARRAPYAHETPPTLPARVHIALSHRLSLLEGQTRGWGHTPAAAGNEQDLRAALKAAQKAAAAAERRAERAEGKVDAWRTAHSLAVPDGHPCRWCGQGLKPLNPTGGWFKRWRHIDKAHDEPCKAAEGSCREVMALAAYANADAAERDRRLRQSHGWAFSQLVEDEPWRAFLDTVYRRDHVQGTPVIEGPEPDPGYEPDPADTTH